MSTTMEADHRAIACRHLLAAVDAAPGETYADITARKGLYAELIEKHHLKDPAYPSRNLTTKRYIDLAKAMLQYGNSNTAQLFREGSRTLSAEYLTRIGYSAPSTQAGKNNGNAAGTSSLTGYPEPQSGPGHTGAQANPAPAASASRAPDTATHLKKKANLQGTLDTSLGTAAGSKRTRVEIEDDEEAAARPQKSARLDVLQSGPSPLSPTAPDAPVRQGSPGAGGKRKRVIEEDKDSIEARPSKTARPTAATSKPQEQTLKAQEQTSKQKEDASKTLHSTVATSKPQNNALKAKEQTSKPNEQGMPQQPIPHAMLPPQKSAAATSTSAGPETVTKSQPTAQKTYPAASSSSAPAHAASIGQGGAAGKKRQHTEIEDDDEVVDTVPVHPWDPAYKNAKTTRPVTKKARLEGGAPHGGTEQQKSAIDVIRDDPLGPHGHRVETLGDDAIESHLKKIWSTAVVAANMILDPDALNAPQAAFVASPQADLDSLYTRLFGKRWRRQTTVTRLAGKIGSTDLLAAVLAAAVYEWVHGQPASWTTPREELQRMQAQHQMVGFNKFFEEMGRGAREMSIQKATWHMGYGQAHDPDFHKFVLRPIAEDLADKLWVVILPQLAALNIQKKTPAEAEEMYDQWGKEFVQMFEEALILKAKIKATDGHYFAHWIEPGADFAGLSMFDVRDQDGRHAREVLWCVSPSFTFREANGGTPRPFVRAKVYARPKTASGSKENPTQ